MGHTEPAASARTSTPAAPAPVHSGGRMHILIALALAVLTVLAFGAVWGNLLPSSLFLPVLLVLALAQIALQTMFYMRLRFDSRKFTLVFSGGVLLAVVIVIAVRLLLVRY